MTSWFAPALRRSLSCLLIVGVICMCAVAQAAPSIEPAAKPRVLVLTDIGNEPDDSESMVRFLLYANEFDVEGLLAVTSTWQRSVVHPELIEERVRAYGQVLPNLQAHASGYPDMQNLLGLIRAGRPAYGMAGVGAGKDTEASRLIIAAADRPDPRPLWLTLWGGTTDLAQALWTVRSTRSSEAVARFVAKLRVYSISDQDDAASWIRASFPSLFWIVSLHAFGDYRLATWIGVSAPQPGADFSVVSPGWLESHIRKGPLGALYPPPKYIMEGDTPSFLYLIPNGLGSSEHPDWGSWGGRYGRVGPGLGVWSDSTDHVKGVDNLDYFTNQASVWRWRREFQNDFAARMAWTLSPDFARANHPPEVVVNGAQGRSPVAISACEDSTVSVSAAGTSDPDHNGLVYHWWQYREATGGVNPQELVITGADTADARVAIPRTQKPAPNVDTPAEVVYHVVLSVTDDGTPALTRYRRVLLTVPTVGTPAARTLGCGDARQNPTG
jgi:hypothetical protein